MPCHRVRAAVTTSRHLLGQHTKNNSAGSPVSAVGTRIENTHTKTFECLETVNNRDMVSTLCIGLVPDAKPFFFSQYKLQESWADTKDPTVFSRLLIANIRVD